MKKLQVKRKTHWLERDAPSFLAHAENVGVDSRLNWPVVVEERRELLLGRCSSGHVGECSVIAPHNHLGFVVPALREQTMRRRRTC